MRVPHRTPDELVAAIAVLRDATRLAYLEVLAGEQTTTVIAPADVALCSPSSRAAPVESRPSSSPRRPVGARHRPCPLVEEALCAIKGKHSGIAVFMDGSLRPGKRKPALERLRRRYGGDLRQHGRERSRAGLPLLAEHINTCFGLFVTHGEADADLQDWFLA